MYGKKMKSDYEEHMQAKYEIKDEAKEFPLMCVVAIDYVCNAKCPACPYTISDIREVYSDNIFIKEETFKTIVDQCAEHNSYIRLSAGGEPMLHPQLIDFIEYAKDKGVKVGLITNGSKFTEENTLRLIKSNIDMIEISVDAADDETYSKVRVGLDWKKLVKNVRRLVDLRNELKSQTKIIVSAISQDGVNLDEVEEFWKPKVDLVQLRKYLVWGRGDSSKAGDPTPYLNDDTPCPHIFERLNIDSKCQVSVCGYDIDFNIIVGNIHEKKIKDIWLSDKMNYYRDMHLKGKIDEIEICKNCTDRKYRSWKYNYWKIIDKAEVERKKIIK